MFFRRHASTSVLFAPLLVLSLLLLVSGCGSESATAKNGGEVGEPADVRDAKNEKAPEVDFAEPQAASETASASSTPRRPGDSTRALAAAGDRPYDKTFDDLRFEMEIGEPFDRSMLTPEIVAMIGQRIRIRGYILPTAQKRGIQQFVLVRDNQECCFGPGAALYDCIFIEMQSGKSTEFTIRPVAVTGIFSIDEVIGPDGNHWAIYRIDAEEVRLRV